MKKIAIRRKTIAYSLSIYILNPPIVVKTSLVIRNDEIQQAQKRKEKGLPEGKAKSRKSETKKYQRHRYQLCSKMYVQL